MSSRLHQIIVGSNVTTGSGNGLLTGLVSYWALDDTGGTDAVDAHGSYDGVETGGTVFGDTGVINGSRIFDDAGSGIYLMMSTITELGGVTQASLSVWCKRANVSNTAPDAIAVGTTAAYDSRFGMTVFGDTVYASASNGSNTYASVLHGHVNDTWAHVVMVYDGTQGTATDRMKIYLNGSPAGGLSFTGTLPTTLDSSGDQGNFSIGKEVGAVYSDGNIDEVGLWTRALSAGDVTSLYNSGSGLAYGSFTS